ncbi:hypothetical protein PFISCL1PPCAC_18702, partial [Pristionchus fissidentatus]
PFGFLHLDNAALSVEQNLARDPVCPLRPSLQGDTVTLGAQDSADLREIAVLLHFVLERCRLHEERKGILECSIDALSIVAGEELWIFRLRFVHVLPHLEMRGNPRFLKRRK